jgi:hypothetical protein
MYNSLLFRKCTGRNKVFVRGNKVVSYFYIMLGIPTIHCSQLLTVHMFQPAKLNINAVISKLKYYQI